MPNISSSIKKALGLDEITKSLSDNNSTLAAHLEEQDRQIKRLSESLAYANHQLLEVRERMERVEGSSQKPIARNSRAQETPALNGVEQKILESIQKSGALTASEASLMSGLSRTRASEILNELVRKRSISKEKRGKTSIFLSRSDVSTMAAGGAKETT